MLASASNPVGDDVGRTRDALQALSRGISSSGIIRRRLNPASGSSRLHARHRYDGTVSQAVELQTPAADCGGRGGNLLVASMQDGGPLPRSLQVSGLLIYTMYPIQ
jgi:hypothetical protein